MLRLYKPVVNLCLFFPAKAIAEEIKWCTLSSLVTHISAEGAVLATADESSSIALIAAVAMNKEDIPGFPSSIMIRARYVRISYPYQLLTYRVFLIVLRIRNVYVRTPSSVRWRTEIKACCESPTSIR